MDAIEKAIRSALQKGNATDQAFRERVYKSAFAALERALEARESVTDETAERRRQALRAKIGEIESEFMPAAEMERPSGSAASTAPDVSPSDRLERAGEHPLAEEPISKRRPFATLFMIALLLAAVGTGVWWTLQTGILESIESRDGQVPNPPPELKDESFRPEKLPEEADSGVDNDIPRNWIMVFEPAVSTDVTVPSGAKAELSQRDGEDFLRISSQGGAEVLFDIGEGTLERIAGGKALFSISARAQEEEMTQISVACDLAELGDCGRKRYEVGAALSEFLFEIEPPNRDPGAAGTIAINPDISGGGMQLDIKEIRIAITE
ncbi:MAG: hypothetical protein AB3N20_10360 [Rhizobiaceae bacterium]